MNIDLPSEGGALLRPAELAARLGYSVRTIRRWSSARRLPYIGPRHRPRYVWNDVVEALRTFPSEEFSRRQP